MNSLRTAVFALAAVAPTFLACGQADYFEGFDNNGQTPENQWGPVNLINKGWVFRNQSSPQSSQVFHDGYLDPLYFPPPQQGAGYLAADPFNVSPMQVSSWAIVPTVPDQAAGDTVAIYVNAMETYLESAFEVRYSPSGNTGTGSGPDAVGDFTVVLAASDPVPVGGWTLLQATVPGTGRLALRQKGAWENWSGGMYVGIDSLSVGPAPEPPCHMPPIPQPGQNVTWTLADSPYEICTDTPIPADSTVTVEPGVVVTVIEGSSLLINGTVKAHGTADKPIVLNGGITFYDAPLEIPDGTLDLRFAEVTGRVLLGHGGSLLALDSEFTGGGTISADEGAPIFDDDRWMYVELRRCRFEETVLLNDCTLVVHDCQFQNASLALYRGYLWIDDVDISGGNLYSNREWPAQPLFIDNVRIQAGGASAGIALDGGNHLLGPRNTVSGAQYPIEALAGLLPGTSIPEGNNTYDGIHMPLGELTPRGRLFWADLAVPYIVSGTPLNGTAGELTIEPGTTVRFNPGASWSFLGGQRLVAEGLPSRPITFESNVPGQRWNVISFNSNSNLPRLESVIVRESSNGIVASDTPFVTLQDCLMEDNGHAAGASVFGYLLARKTRFYNNDVGIWTDSYPVSHGSADLDGRSNPNSFVGNTLAVEITNSDANTPAEFNWWGHATGPDAPQNPNGQGDAIGGIGASGVDVIPFLTSPPDFTDHPPIVRVKEPYFLKDAGTTLFVEWEASDDGQIVEQKILYTPHGANPPFEVIAVLPPDQRRYEFIVPIADPSANTIPPFVRILAVDDAGQENFDDISFGTPYTEDWQGTLTPVFNTQEVYRPGERVDVCWQVGDGASGTIDAWVVLDADESSVPLGGAHTGVECLSLGMVAPDVSTDTARILLALHGGAGRTRYFFTDTFTIRPDPRVGDAAPTVTMTAPQPGDSFAGGSVVPISWTAFDDTGLRSISIQASLDGGRTWDTIARDLPGNQTSFNWLIPPSQGVPEVRIRVIAHDIFFQNTSDGAEVAFSILPGEGCYADRDGNGALDLFDFLAYVNTFNAGDLAADCTADGALDLFDFLCFVNAFNAGC
jgi:hypothetical protein